MAVHASHTTRSTAKKTARQPRRLSSPLTPLTLCSWFLVAPAAAVTVSAYAAPSESRQVTSGAVQQDTAALPTVKTETPSTADAALPPVNVTGDGIAGDPARQPFGVTSIGAKAIVERRLDSVEQVLQSTPGVSVNSSGGVLDNSAIPATLACNSRSPEPKSPSRHVRPRLGKCP